MLKFTIWPIGDSKYKVTASNMKMEQMMHEKLLAVSDTQCSPSCSYHCRYFPCNVRGTVVIRLCRYYIDLKRYTQYSEK